MALIVDAGALFAQADAEEPRHEAVARVLVAEREALVTTELAVAEADDLILTRLGVGVELSFLEDLAMGTYIVECLTRDELRAAREVVEWYRDLRLGPANASLVVLAHRYGTVVSSPSTSPPSGACPLCKAAASPSCPRT